MKNWRVEFISSEGHNYTHTGEWTSWGEPIQAETEEQAIEEVKSDMLCNLCENPENYLFRATEIEF